MFDFLKKIFQPALPNAALAWQQAGKQPQSAYWLYAAPVHLVLQRDSFSLAAPVPLELDSTEIDSLTHTLNTHFAADGMQFFWHQQQWFLRLEQNPNIETVHPQRAINQDINAFLPTGKGAGAWASFQNELQMLLFEHPVNMAREKQRLQTVNSVWCYGGGQLEQLNK
ncbi:MAG: hypothetical protein V4575_09660 [Pseudomonadota bacterium]